MRFATRLASRLCRLGKVMFVVAIAVAAIMAPAAMGVQIGPLIAGAGVVGVAVGFVAQTFVRDVIAGMFYLMDAFRVGEYIQSGNYMGMVEGFSIHSSGRGTTVARSRPCHSEPELTIGVAYDSDLGLACELIKQIGSSWPRTPNLRR